MRIVLRTVLNTAIFGYFRYILRFEFAKTIVVFQISTLKFTNSQSFMQKEKTLNLGLTWVLSDCNFERLLPFLKSKPSNFSKCKVSFKTKKNCRFKTKNALFEYFTPKIEKKLLSCSKSTPSILSKSKVLFKNIST